MPFSIEEFVTNPTQEVHESLKKGDLISLAKHYQLTNIKQSIRKHEIKNSLMYFLAEEEIFDETALALIVERFCSGTEKNGNVNA